ncbi:type II toxin-antitoxin system Phd/YefM family antitoxin [uncultured Selenomonas sp.]|uniref:type II toxin-antitoxin system Phd/YefM family antitoxin n=1 Tax=uncultured Selenomonas sp. TaxID=159275 RepID=UPI0028E38322|nr:type II toxin-antitoxin system Phd/YefM family antitoxin [uncultured Selenomonas sp.]
MAHAMPLNNTVSITAFNRGKAGQIFSNVKKNGMTVVMKNNEPECILLSPAQYEAMLETRYDAELLSIAEARLQNHNEKDTVSFEDVCKSVGISATDLEQMDEVEIE